MALQDIVRWLLPREDVFYTLIEQLAELLEGTADALATFTQGVPADQVFEAVRKLENQADKVVYEAEEQFAKVFVTPIDREDIQTLIRRDRRHHRSHVPHLAYVRALRHRQAERGDGRADEAARGARSLSTSRAPGAAAPRVRALDRRGPSDPRAREDRRQDLSRGRRGSVSHPEISAKILLRDKEVLEELEKAVNKFEYVAERLKNLAVKHG